MFCKHEWKILVSEVTKSKYESSVELAKAQGITGKFTLPHQLCCGDRKHIQIVTCDKCGKLKRFVENI